MNGVLDINKTRAHASQTSAFLGTQSAKDGPSTVWSLQQAQAKQMYPSGLFNTGSSGGPMAVLDTQGRKQNKLDGKGTENLQRTQTQYVPRANLTRLVLPIWMPEPFKTRGVRQIYRTLATGDAMFSIRMTQQMVASGDATPVTRHNHPQQVFTMNLQTVNYLLLNLQECIFHKLANQNANDEPTYLHWCNYFSQMMPDQQLNNASDPAGFEDFPAFCPIDFKTYATLKRYLWRFIKNYVRVTGVYIGSEQQGGQHQGAVNPCSHNPTDYVGTVQTTGKFEKTRNIWTTSQRGVGNGDLLGFTLKYVPASQDRLISFRISLSSNASTPQQAQISSDSHEMGRFLLVPAVYESMLDAPAEDAQNILSLYEQLRFTGSLLELQTQVLVDNSPGISVHGGYFMQFGVVNEMSKNKTGSRDALTYALDATACTEVMNCEVVLRFTVGEPPRSDESLISTQPLPASRPTTPETSKSDKEADLDIQISKPVTGRTVKIARARVAAPAKEIDITPTTI